MVTLSLLCGTVAFLTCRVSVVPILTHASLGAVAKAASIQDFA